MKKMTVKWWVLVLAVMMVISLTACSQPAPAPAPEPAPAEANPVEEGSTELEDVTAKVGIIYSMSGGGSALGNAQATGAQLAIDEINRNGGIVTADKRIMLEAVVRDDETAVDVSVRRFRELTQDEQVDLLVGGTFAHISSALSEQVRQNPIFFMATNGVPEEFFHKDTKASTSLCIVGSTVSSGRSAAAYVANEIKPAKVVLLLPDYAYGHDQEKGAMAVFANYPEIEVVTMYSTVGAADMTPYLINARNEQPDLLMMGQWGNDAINILKQTEELGLNQDMDIWFNWLVNVFATGLPPEALDGVTTQMLWYHNMEGFRDAEVVTASNVFTEAWLQVDNDPPDPYAMAAYMGVMEMARGIELANSIESNAVYAALMANPDFNSMNGPAKWRVDGRPEYRYWPYVVVGKGADERDDMMWDFATVVDAYEGDEFLPPLSELGY
ncbi:ABC transporter substrate-binding protein [Anoxynatronum buryatiense]|uniref:Branched-chain amino acid transport system substrate-binding protein n=1 Tax=Anoxynatronum buryatiense TaxID=489973 RepID=A0AA45WVH3_9CLOT|nr:ABC transporter substrate-binding protein [Anoxynatronum buryatiense]SMP53842.1 branched-chain amino acid transport system substrate-binding protein [Anoxynatronum buryatiense]